MRAWQVPISDETWAAQPQSEASVPLSRHIARYWHPQPAMGPA